MAAQVRDYFGVAIMIAHRRFQILLDRYRMDVEQECRFLAWQAEELGFIVVEDYQRCIRYENGGKIDLRLFTSAVSAQLYVMKKRYLGHWKYREEPYGPGYSLDNALRIAPGPQERP